MSVEAVLLVALAPSPPMLGPKGARALLRIVRAAAGPPLGNDEGPACQPAPATALPTAAAAKRGGRGAG